MSSDSFEPFDLRAALIALSKAAAFEGAAPGNDNGRSTASPRIDTVEAAIGEPLFQHAQGSSDLSAAGRHLLVRAKQILAEHDKYPRSIDATHRGDPVRVGISSMLLDFLVDHPGNEMLARAIVTSDVCSKIVKEFGDDELDIAMVMDVRDHRSLLGDDLVADFDIEFAWLQADRFVPAAGEPIPIAIWPPDRHIILNSLSEAGRSYKVMFNGPDYAAKLTAVRSGQCLAVVPRHAIAPPFRAAENDHLPAIPPKKILLAVRGDPASERFRTIVDAMSSFPLSGTGDEALS